MDRSHLHEPSFIPDPAGQISIPESGVDEIGAECTKTTSHVNTSIKRARTLLVDDDNNAGVRILVQGAPLV